MAQTHNNEELALQQSILKVDLELHRRYILFTTVLFIFNRWRESDKDIICLDWRDLKLKFTFYFSLDPWVAALECWPYTVLACLYSLTVFHSLYPFRMKPLLEERALIKAQIVGTKNDYEAYQRYPNELQRLAEIEDNIKGNTYGEVFTLILELRCISIL